LQTSPTGTRAAICGEIRRLWHRHIASDTFRESSSVAAVELPHRPLQPRPRKAKKHKREHGDYMIAFVYPKDPLALGYWVANQKSRKKLLDRGEPSVEMTAERVAKLVALEGFF
jgi:hypothetical protein